MQKTNLLIILLSLLFIAIKTETNSITQEVNDVKKETTEEPVINETTDTDTEENEIDLEEIAKNIDTYFEGKVGPVTYEEALDVLLLTYTDMSLREVEELQFRLEELDDIDPLEEEKFYIKLHLQEFLSEKYKGKELTTYILKDIIRKGEIIPFIEERVIDEDYDKMRQKVEERKKKFIKGEMNRGKKKKKSKKKSKKRKLKKKKKGKETVTDNADSSKTEKKEVNQDM